MPRSPEAIEKAKAAYNALKDVPCMDCGGRFPPECMDFDHVRGEKKFTIGPYVLCADQEWFLEEVLKCDIVCANCHRIRTKNRMRDRQMVKSSVSETEV